MNFWPLFFLLTSTVLAQDLCTRNQSQIKQHLLQVDSRISFENQGGLINGGVCWWHSRLQRASGYLVKFEPERSPPSGPELDHILYSLRTMKQTISIPGYTDFFSFTKDYQKPIQAMLEEWQRRDGFLNFEWIRGISGKHTLPAGEMRERMDKVYNFYKSSPAPVWIMAQIKGITSHSFLLISMETHQTGYELEVIDSNHPLETIKISYHSGDTSLKNDKYTFVPYVGFQNDYRLIFKALAQRCGDSLTEPEVPEGEIEAASAQY